MPMHWRVLPSSGKLPWRDYSFKRISKSPAIILKQTIANKIPFSFITTSLNANCTIVLSYQEFFEERQTERLGWDREQQDAISDRITKSAQATT